MLDDLTLEGMFADAAESIVVPDGGPQRIMAARDAAVAPRSRDSVRARSRDSVRARSRYAVIPDAIRRRPLRSAVVVLASCAMAGLVAGVANGGGSQVSGSASRNEALPGAPFAPNAGGASSSAAQPGAQDQAGGAGQSAGAGQQGTPDLVPGSTLAKVIKNGSMTLRVTSVESALEQFTTMVHDADGFVASTSMSSPRGTQPSSADVTLRVPEDAFESFTSRIEKLGSPSQVTMSGQDVTSEYSDLKARLQALQSTINQLELIETKANTIGDVLAVEQQISDQQTQADQIQGQINVLDAETTYGSLSVHLFEPQTKAALVPPPPSGLSKAWDHARSSFAHGVEAVVGALGGIAVFLLCTGILLGIARLGWTAVRRRLV